MMKLHYELLGGSSAGITHNAPMTLYNAHGDECRDHKANLLFSANDVQHTMCSLIVGYMIYISQFIKKTDRKVIMYFPSPAFGGVQCGCE